MRMEVYMNNTEKTMDKIVALCKTRGFIFPGSEIYGGLANTWDYGPLGVELKNNVKKAWWKKFVQENKREKPLTIQVLYATILYYTVIIKPTIIFDKKGRINDHAKHAVLFSPVLKFTADLLTLGITVLLELNSRTTLRRLGGKNSFRSHVTT